MHEKVIIGTRGSDLALWQAYYTRDKLQAAGYEVELRIIKTKGDRIQHLSFDKIEGKGFFTKEIEDGLLSGEIDLAVHSCKDLPSQSPEGLEISAWSDRAAPSDALLIRPGELDDRREFRLKDNAVVGTSSARRKAQLLAFRPDLQIRDIRGNVPTRIEKLRSGDFDAILLAAAGLNRLEIEVPDLVREDLSPTKFIPAPAQGVLAYQIRSNDDRMRSITRLLADPVSNETTRVERSLLEAFEGGCQVPLGIYARKHGDRLHLWISRASAWDSVPVRMHLPLNRKDISPQSLTRRVKEMRPLSVFITRELRDTDYFRDTLEACGFKVRGRSLIGFEPVVFDPVPETADWMFFVSRNGVKYYFEQGGKVPSDCRVAAVNGGTAHALRHRGIAPDFIGEGGDLEAIARSFDVLPGDQVHFMRAETSNRTIQGYLEHKSVADHVVYRNFPVTEPPEIDETVVVFTSPMNVESYLAKNEWRPSQKAVAIGPTTAAALKERDIGSRVAWEPTLWALVDEVTAAAVFQ